MREALAGGPSNVSRDNPFNQLSGDPFNPGTRATTNSTRYCGGCQPEDHRRCHPARRRARTHGRVYDIYSEHKATGPLRAEGVGL